MSAEDGAAKMNNNYAQATNGYPAVQVGLVKEFWTEAKFVEVCCCTTNELLCSAAMWLNGEHR